MRSHIHIIISGADYAAIQKTWIYGVAKIQIMKDALFTAGYLSKTFAEMPAGEHHYVRSRNLENPNIETKTLDVRYLPDIEELEAITKCPKEYAAVFYPDYELIAEPEIWKSSYMPGCYVRIEMICGDHSGKIATKINNYHIHQANELLNLHKNPILHSNRDP